MHAEEVTTAQLLSAYVCGDITADERADVEKYLADEPGARCDVSSLHELTGILKSADLESSASALALLRQRVLQLIEELNIHAALAASLTGEINAQEKDLTRAHLAAHPAARAELRKLESFNALLKHSGDRVAGEALGERLRARMNVALPAAIANGTRVPHAATKAPTAGYARPISNPADETRRSGAALTASDRQRPSLRVFAARDNPWKKRLLTLSGLAALLALWAGVGALRKNWTVEPVVNSDAQEPSNGGEVFVEVQHDNINHVSPVHPNDGNSNVAQTPPSFNESGNDTQFVKAPDAQKPNHAPDNTIHDVAQPVPAQNGHDPLRNDDPHTGTVATVLPEHAPRVNPGNATPPDAQAAPNLNLLTGNDDAATQIAKATNGVPQKSNTTVTPTTSGAGVGTGVSKTAPNTGVANGTGATPTIPPGGVGGVAATTTTDPTHLEGASANTPPVAASGPATVGSLKGTGVAQVTFNGTTSVLKKDDAIESGATLETSDNVHVALQIPGGGKLYVNSNSKLSLTFGGKGLAINLAAGEVYVTTALGGGTVALTASKIRIDQAVEADVAIAGQVRVGNLGAKALKVISSGAKSQTMNVEGNFQASVSPDGTDAIRKDALAAQTGNWRQDVMLDGDGLKAISTGVRSRR